MSTDPIVHKYLKVTVTTSGGKKGEKLMEERWGFKVGDRVEVFTGEGMWVAATVASLEVSYIGVHRDDWVGGSAPDGRWYATKGCIRPLVDSPAKPSFEVGDRVRITRKWDNDGELSNPGWGVEMDKTVGMCGKVNHIEEETGYVLVEFVDNPSWWYLPSVLEKLPATAEKRRPQVGDRVRATFHREVYEGTIDKDDQTRVPFRVKTPGRNPMWFREEEVEVIEEVSSCEDFVIEYVGTAQAPRDEETSWLRARLPDGRIVESPMPSKKDGWEEVWSDRWQGGECVFGIGTDPDRRVQLGAFIGGGYGVSLKSTGDFACWWKDMRLALSRVEYNGAHRVTHSCVLEAKKFRREIKAQEHDRWTRGNSDRLWSFVDHDLPPEPNPDWPDRHPTGPLKRSK